MKGIIRYFWRVMVWIWDNVMRFGHGVRNFWRKNKAGVVCFYLLLWLDITHTL